MTEILAAPAELLTPPAHSTGVDLTALEKVELDTMRLLAGGWTPDTFLRTVISRPDGSTRLWLAWSEGGTMLGDVIDAAADIANLDAVDCAYITSRNATTLTKGRIRVLAVPLHPFLADVANGVRARGQVRRDLAEKVRLPAAPGVGAAGRAWTGVGPACLGVAR